MKRCKVVPTTICFDASLPFVYSFLYSALPEDLHIKSNLKAPSAMKICWIPSGRIIHIYECNNHNLAVLKGRDFVSPNSAHLKLTFSNLKVAANSILVSTNDLVMTHTWCCYMFCPKKHCPLWTAVS